MTFISTLAGVIGAIALFVYAITSNTDNYLMFVSPSSVAMVFGGTAAATIISYSFKDFINAIIALFYTFSSDKSTNGVLKKDVQRFVQWSQQFRKGGLTGLQNSLSEQDKKDPFLIHCLELIGAGYKPDDFHLMVSRRIEADFTKSTQGAKVLHTMAGYAPAFGMVGTVIGLIIMLDNMEGDIAALGKGLALALITTLYGVMLAQLVFRPAAVHIFKKQEGEYFRHQLWCHGFVYMLEKQDALSIQDKLNALLDPNAYFNLTDANKK